MWELSSKPSICPHCPVGCDISLDMRYNKLMRVMPRENDFVNEIWICDKGRFGMRYFESGERLKTPMIRRNNQWAQVTWDEALRFVAEKLAQIRTSVGAEALGGLAGPKLANEDLYLFQKLFREVLGSNNLDHRTGAAGEPPLDDLVPALGVGAGTNLMTLGKGTAVLVVGADPEEEAPLYMLRLRGIVDRGGDLTVVQAHPTKLERFATRGLRTRPGAEAHLVAALMSAIFEENLQKDDFITPRLRGVEDLRRGLGRLPIAQLAEVAGVAEDSIRAAARAFATAENGIIVYGRAALSAGQALTQALANLALITGKVGRPNNGLIALLPAGNSRGALDMGIRPDAGPGGAALPQRGLSAREMWGAAVEGRLRGMYIAGLNPARASDALAEALTSLEFLVVQDLFMTETAQLADVVLPATTFAEREGTFTNAERRVQRFRQARDSEGDLPADWMIFQDVARAIQDLVPAPPVVAETKKSTRARATTTAVTVAAPPMVWDYVVSSDIADEISRGVPGYRGTSYTSLELTRKSWGRQPNEPFYYDGTSYTNPEGVGIQLPAQADDGKSIFAVAFREPELPGADERYPFTLMTPARLYDGGEWVRGSRLEAHVPPAHVILSVADAQRLGVAIGERVQVRSAAGALELPAQIDGSLADGLVLIPRVRGANLAAILTGARTRVAVSKLE